MVTGAPSVLEGNAGYCEVLAYSCRIGLRYRAGYRPAPLRIPVLARRAAADSLVSLAISLHSCAESSPSVGSGEPCIEAASSASRLISACISASETGACTATYVPDAGAIAFARH